MASRAAHPFGWTALSRLARFFGTRGFGRALTLGVAAALVVTLADVPALPSRSAAAAVPAVAPANVTCPVERSDEMAALITARFCGGEVEVASLRSESTQVWARPDGRLRADLAAGPVRMRDGRGGWVPVDLTLQRRPDGSVAPKAHPSGLVLSGAAGAGGHDLAVLGVGDEQVRLGWGGPLPEPTLSGTKATYVEVRAGVDLVVEVTRTGFEQFLVVKTRAAIGQVARIAMPWRHGGLVTRAAGRGLGLWTADGRRQVWQMPAPVMWDARTNPETGDPAHVMAVGLASVVRSAGGSELVLTPDAAFLADPAIEFPVTIDPSITTTAGFDTYVQNDSSTSHDTATELRIGTTVSGATTTRSFLRFDMTRCTASGSVRLR